MKRFCAAVLLAGAVLWAQATSKWVYFGVDHRLQYRTDERGNRILDFSYAGYRGGGVRLTDVPVAKTLSPVAGDNTARIQEALDSVSQGAVLLAPGTYEVAGTLKIQKSGVVLRGSGSGDGGTSIVLTGTPHRFLEIRGAGTWAADGKSAAIVDAYIPSGTDSFSVADATGYHAGDAVLVRRPVTEAWVHFMGMDTLVRDGKKQTWVKAGGFIRTDRTIRQVEGNRITLDAPLTDSFDAKLLTPPGPSLVHYNFGGRISEVGVENLRVSAPAQDAAITEKQYTVLLMDAVVDGWARNIVVQETQNGIVLGAATKRITLDGIAVKHSILHNGSAAPADFSISGTEILVNKCGVDGDGTWALVTQAEVTGPIVVLNFSGSASSGISPHQRWATGVLVDGAVLPKATKGKPGIAFSNRKTAGSGHGWDVGWAVAWNVRAPFLLVQQPPGSMNWCVGCVGQAIEMPGIEKGILDSPGNAVSPASLYLEQLRERLGETAVKNIGY